MRSVVNMPLSPVNLQPGARLGKRNRAGGGARTQNRILLGVMIPESHLRAVNQSEFRVYAVCMTGEPHPNPLKGEQFNTEQEQKEDTEAGFACV